MLTQYDSIDIDIDFTSHASRILLRKQQEVIKQGAGAFSGKTAGEPSDRESYGKDPLIGEHPAMKVPTEEESAKLRQTPEDSVGGEASDRKADATVVGKEKNGPTQPQSIPEPHLDGARNQENVALQVRDCAENSEAQGGSKGEGESVPAPEVLREEEKANMSRVELITAHLNAKNIQMTGTATDDESMDDFRPHIFHTSHSPVPIDMVNRMPRGSKFTTRLLLNE